jgi:hypothetical protein
MNTAPSSSSASAKESAGATSSPEAIEVEKKLLKTIMEYLQFTYKQYNDIRNSRNPELALNYTNELLNNLRQCLKNVMITQMEKNQLRESLLSERTRAEIMHVAVTLGDNVSTSADQRNLEEWKQTRDAFMSFLD